MLRIRKRNKIVSFILYFIIVASLVFDIVIEIMNYRSSVNDHAILVLPDFIENYDYNSVISIDKIEFEHKWDRNRYVATDILEVSEEIDTNTTVSEDINSDDNSIIFFRYDSFPLFDAVFTDKYELDTLEFDVTSHYINSQSLIRTGFWVNASISNDNKITGYMVMMGETDLSKTSLVPFNEKTKITLFYVENLDIDAFNNSVQKTIEDHQDSDGSFGFPDSISELAENISIAADPLYFLPTSCTLLETYDGDDISSLSELTDIHFRIKSLDSSFQVYLTSDNQEEILLVDKETSSDAARGFGIYSQNISQGNDTPMHIRYDNVYIKDVPTEETTAQVNFILSDTEISIVKSQIKTGFVGERYKIRPSKIPGYQYSGASREILDPLVYDDDEMKNVTDLFYVEANKKY